MFKAARRFIVVIGMLTVFPSAGLKAQDAGQAEFPSGHNTAIDEALDQIEERLYQASAPQPSVPPQADEAPLPDQEESTAVEVQVLEDVHIMDDVSLTTTEETDNVPQDEPKQALPLAQETPAQETQPVTVAPPQAELTPGGPQTKVIPLLHAEASTILDSLNEMKSEEGQVTYNESDRTLILKDQ